MREEVGGRKEIMGEMEAIGNSLQHEEFLFI